jgi:hypothetical protein
MDLVNGNGNGNGNKTFTITYVDEDHVRTQNSIKSGQLDDFTGGGLKNLKR